MRVAAGAVAKLVLRQAGIEVVAWVSQVGSLVDHSAPESVQFELVNNNEVRCADPSCVPLFREAIQQARAEKDTIGGQIGFCCRSVPAGLGEPVFDKLEADLAKGMMSLPASKGFEIGSGFAGSTMRGSTHNDVFVSTENGVRTKTNYSGGIQGGISNGMTIYGKVAFKPVATLLRPQDTVDQDGETAIVSPKGRHDPCVLPRAVPIVEAMAALTLADHWLRNRAINEK